MSEPAEHPVGFFDSGVGGTCILAAFRRLRPDVPVVYIADTANCPYGNKSADEIVRLAEKNTEKLLKNGCRLVVVACNTATAAAIDILRAKYQTVTFVGLEPAVKPAALQSKSGVVAVLATQGTFNGRLYRETSARFARNVTLIATVADEFVTLVEQAVKPGTIEVDPRRLRTKTVERIVRAKVEPLLAAGADHLVLGCTHFPHLREVMEKVVAGRAVVVDPSEAVARQAVRVYERMTK